MDTVWTVVRTKPRRELWAQQNVQRQGRETFLPRLRPDPLHNIFKPAPLFPSYLFVLITTGQWYFLRGTFGVACPVMRNGEPAVVPLKVIEELKRRQGRDGLIALPKHRFDPGQKVRVCDGPFQYQIGLFQDMTSNQRVQVLFGNLKVTIADKLLEAA